MGRASRPRPERLAKKLLQIRMALKLSQDGMLDRLGLSETSYRSVISAFERGEREPPLPVLLKYSKTVGISTDTLIDDQLELPNSLSQRRYLNNQWTHLHNNNVTQYMHSTSLTLKLSINCNNNNTKSDTILKVENCYLCRYSMRTVTDNSNEYILTFKHIDNLHLKAQVQDLLNDITEEVIKYNCTVDFNIQEI